MQIVKYINRVVTDSWRVIVHPRQHWLDLKKTRNETSDVFTHLFVPGLVLMFLAIILGDLLFNSEYGVLLMHSFLKGFRKVVVLIMTFFASTMILYEVSRIFRIPVEFDSAKKIVIYSMLPLVLTTLVTGLLPFLYILGVFGLYSLYLVFSGLVHIYDLDAGKQIPYFFVVILGMFFSYVIIAFLLSKLAALIIY